MTTPTPRRRDEGGYISVMAMSIMLLLLATGMVVFSSASNTLTSSRQARDFEESRQAMDAGFATAVAALNTTHRGQLDTNPSHVGVVEVDRSGGEGRGAWTWSYDHTSHLLTASGTVEGIHEETTRPVRGLAVDSHESDSDGATVYRATANSVYADGTGWGTGAWGNVLTSSGDAVIDVGDGIDGFHAKYGGRLRLVGSPADRAEVISYSDDTRAGQVEGDPEVGFQRSHITAGYSAAQLAQRMAPLSGSFCSSRTLAGVAGGASYGCSAGDAQLAGNFPIPTGQVATYVVDGDLTVLDTSALGGQLHVYVSGTVTFGDSSQSSLDTVDLDNVFIHAPKSFCRARQYPARYHFDHAQGNGEALSVRLKGALACHEMNLLGHHNRFTHLAPLADDTSTPEAAAGAGDTVLYHTERPGFIDELSNGA